MKKAHVIRALADRLGERYTNKAINTTMKIHANAMASVLDSFETLASAPVVSSPGTHVSKLLKAGTALKTKALQLENFMYEALSNEMSVQNTEANKKAGLTLGGQGMNAQEIRGLIRAMDPGQQASLLRDASPEVLSAVHGVDPLLSGVAPDLLTAVINKRLETYAPDEVAAMTELTDVYGQPSSLVKMVNDSVHAVESSDYVKSVTEQSAASDAAHSDFLANIGM